MGCLQSSTSSDAAELTDREENQEAPKQYSWDKREKIDPADYTIDGKTGETVGRVPGTVNGQPFVIQNCKDCNIYVFDHLAQVTIDDCTNCRIFLGPIKTSIFVRDCRECVLMTACQQLRTRDCHRLTLYLCCVSQPIIESSTSVKFACFQYNYPELEAQFKAVSFSIYNNNWSNIHDFTPVPGEQNYTLLSEDSSLHDNLPPPAGELFSGMQIEYSKEKSLVPYTHGTRRKSSEESCLVCLFSDGTAHERAIHFIAQMAANHRDCLLIQTKEMTVNPRDAARIFGSESYQTAVEQGPMIGLEFSGLSVCTACQQTVMNVSTGTTGLAFISPNPQIGSENVDNFFSYADMQMNV